MRIAFVARVDPRVSLLAVSLASLLGACAPLPSRSIIPSRGDSLPASVERYEVDARPMRRPLPDPPSTTAFVSQNATPERRRDTVDRIWRTIDDQYYDPRYNGVDVAALRKRTFSDAEAATNDAAFYRALKRDVDALKDSHTTILTPRQAAQGRTQRATQIGIVIDMVDDRVVIREVMPGFPAAEQGVRAGMIIDGIDSHAIDDAFIAQAVRAPITADGVDVDDAVPAEDSAERSRRRVLAAIRALLIDRETIPRDHRLVLRRRDDSVFTIDVRARVGDVPTVERFALRPSGIAVLRLSRFDMTKRRELARDLEAARVESRGLILDLRENPGGEVRLFRWLVGRFLDRPRSVGTMTIRERGEAVTVEIPSDGDERANGTPYAAPIAVLTDRRTASAAEWTARALVELRGAIVVGDSTCGCVVGLRREFLLPDGGVLRVAEVGFHSALGDRMEGDPLRPTIVVSPTLAELRADDDVVLVAAERALLERPASRQEIRLQ
jgi:carboxyl-terminal processing protease